MMNFFLKLKHWQLFLLIWGIPILLSIVSNMKTGLPIMVAFPVMMLFFVFGLFGWIWAIATGLREKVRPEVKLNLTAFKIIFLLPIVYMLTLLIWMTVFAFGGGERSDTPSTFIVVLVSIHLLSMVCIIFGLRYAAKTMRSVELHRAAKFGDYIGEFFLIWFSVVGIWILQPRLNKLMEDHKHDEVQTVPR